MGQYGDYSHMDCHCQNLLRGCLTAHRHANEENANSIFIKRTKRSAHVQKLAW